MGKVHFFQKVIVKMHNAYSANCISWVGGFCAKRKNTKFALSKCTNFIGEFDILDKKYKGSCIFMLKCVIIYVVHRRRSPQLYDATLGAFLKSVKK